MRRWGTALLAADRGRIDGVTALGLDEILMWRHGKYRRKRWGTTIVDARRGILLDIVAGRTANPAIKRLEASTPQWRRAVRWAVMDLSGPYRKAFDTALAHARQVADPFHVVRLANQMVDEVRRRVQNDTLGGRGTKTARCTGSASRSPWPTNASAQTATRSCAACSQPAIPR